MSNVEIERLVQDRNLIRESFDDEQVAGYWTKAMASLVEAQSEGLSTDGAYLMAYTAALQAALAVLAAHNLKVRGTSNHYMTFHAVQKLNATMRDCGRRFDALRLTRHQSLYEPEHDEVDMVKRLARAMGCTSGRTPRQPRRDRRCSSLRRGYACTAQVPSYLKTWAGTSVLRVPKDVVDEPEPQPRFWMLMRSSLPCTIFWCSAFSTRNASMRQ